MSWTPYRADDYLDFDQVESFCRTLADAHPEWVALESVGESGRRRPIYLLTIGKRDDGSQPPRPAIWLDAGTHASEWAGVSAVLFCVSRWVEALADGNPQLCDWFTDREALVMPCISPDGYQAMHDGSPYLRSSLRPPSKGTVRRGLDPCDVDGDGTVRMMRWKHPSGSFVEDPNWAPFLRPRTLDDDPEDAYFLCDEGEFINWNGVEWTRAPKRFGLDLNRNFPAHWKPFSMFGMDSGDYPLSEPESQAVVDTFADHPAIGCALTMHTYMGCILTQPYREDTPLCDGDIELMEQLADDLVDDTGYDVFRVHPEFMYEQGKPIPGVWADTISTVFGIPGYTVEIWNPFEYVGVDIEEPAKFFNKPDTDKLRRFLRGYADIDGAVQSWRTVDHPQLGEVEVGGLEYLKTVRNPPTEQLPQECEKIWKITERARRTLPEVSADIEIRRIGDELHRLRVVLENRGCLATSGLDRGRDLSSTPGCGIRLKLDDGLQTDDALRRSMDHMEGWGNFRTGSGQHPEYATLSTRGHRSFAEWTLRGSGTVTVEWSAGRGGHGSETAAIE